MKYTSKWFLGCYLCISKVNSYFYQLEFLQQNNYFSKNYSV